MNPFQVLEKLQTAVGRKKTLRTCGKAEQDRQKQSPLEQKRHRVGDSAGGPGDSSWAAQQAPAEEP